MGRCDFASRNGVLFMENEKKNVRISNIDEYAAIAKDYDESNDTAADENAADSVLISNDTGADADTDSNINASKDVSTDKPAQASEGKTDSETVVNITEFTSGNNYENSQEKYSNNMSSAITFFICSICGFIVLGLNWFGVLNFIKGKSASSIFTYVVMCLVFLVFLVIAITTLRAALTAKANISKENDTINNIRRWIKDNITIEAVEASYDGDELAEEMRYFYRSSYIRDKVKDEFSSLPDDLLDNITDEFIENSFNSEN